MTTEREEREGGDRSERAPRAAAFRVEPFSPASRPAFDRLHSAANDAGWCRCVAWWTDGWEGFGERTAEENAALRGELCARGEYDGFLLFDADEPVAWCQVGPRDRLAKLRREFELAPDPSTWAVTCFLVAPARRGGGLAARLLAEVLERLGERGVRRVEAFPKRGAELDALDLWNGPEALFRAAGFEVVRDDPVRPVLALQLPRA